jgi:hypothetical protein
MPQVFLSPLGGAASQFLDNNGVILSGGKIYTYAAGTTTPQTSYTSSSGGTAHANPIILDSAGRVPGGEIWLTDNLIYKFTIETSAAVLLGTYDNVPGINDININASTIEYDPPFAGAVTSGYTVSDKLSQYVSVKDFGAVGNGVANDTVAIQAAVTAAGYGGGVFFPKGTYLINAAINVPPASGSISGVNFTGEGPSSIVKPSVGGFTSLFNVTGTQAKFTNLSLDANSTNVTNGILVDLTGNSDVACTVQECTIIGFTAGISAKSQNHYYENNFFLNNTSHIKFTDDGRNTSISGNYMLGGNIGVALYKTAQQAEGTRIINNTILVTAGNGAGIDMTAGLEILISGNIIDQTGSNSIGVYMHPAGADAVSSIKCIGNWIAAGLGSYGAFANGNNTNLYFTNNTFVSNNNLVTLSAISLDSTNTYNILSNRFLMTYASGAIDISATSCTNSTVLGNDSSLPASNALFNQFNSQVAGATAFYAPEFGIGLTGPSITGGSGAPSTTKPIGSLFLRIDGAVGSRLYVSQGAGSWLAVAGV